MNRELFSQNIHQYEHGMYTLAYGILKNPEDASDAVQEAILKAWCSLDSLRDAKQFRPWIMRIVHNTALGFLRGHRETVDIDQQWELSAPEADHDTRLTVWQAVEQLRMPYRLVIILFYYENCDIRQIAAITATPAAAVRQQLSRGRKMLAALLNKEDFLT